MIIIWICALTAVSLVSLVSLIGVLTLSLKLEMLRKLTMFLVSFSAGVLLGGAFFHLIPEAVESGGFTPLLSAIILAGIITFLFLERVIYWRHCHVPTSYEHPHPFALMNLVGDGFHNFIDGMIIAGAFLASIPLGITTTLAVILHEIPQEMGDFGVLIHGGFGRKKALLMNFAASVGAVLGAIVILLLNTKVAAISSFIVPFTAGGFIYIAGSDLIPEMKKETQSFKAILHIITLFLGLGVMLLLLKL